MLAITQSSAIWPATTEWNKRNKLDRRRALSDLSADYRPKICTQLQNRDEENEMSKQTIGWNLILHAFNVCMFNRAYHMWPIKTPSAWLSVAKRTQTSSVRRSTRFYTQWVHQQRVQDNSPARTLTGKTIWKWAMGHFRMCQSSHHSTTKRLTYFLLEVWNWVWQSLHRSTR